MDPPSLKKLRRVNRAADVMYHKHREALRVEIRVGGLGRYTKPELREYIHIEALTRTVCEIEELEALKGLGWSGN